MRASPFVVFLVTLPATAGSLTAQEPTRSQAEALWRAEDTSLAAITEGSVVERLRAIRRAPELAIAPLALPSLARVAAGDDPILAPAAASAAWRIARALELDALLAEEIDLAPLREARAAYLAIANDESARPDLRQLAGFVADALAQLDAAAVWPTTDG